MCNILYCTVLYRANHTSLSILIVDPLRLYLLSLPRLYLFRKAIPYSEMSIGVPKEVAPLEKRVAQTPDTVAKLTKLGITVNVEKGAGEASQCSDDGYKAAGANIVSRNEVHTTNP